MAFSSGFFNSKGLDRTYTAENFTDYLSGLICNGILDTYGDCFELTAPSKGLKVILGKGKAWINGHYFINDESGLTPEQELLADANRDGSINAVDASLVLSFAADLGVGKYSNNQDGWTEFLSDQRAGDNLSPFFDDQNIKSVVVSDGITSLGTFAFNYCNNLGAASLPSTLTKIGRNAFAALATEICGITKISIPSKVTEIGQYAFANTQITSLTIPRSVTSVGYYACRGCADLATVRYEGAVIGSYMFAGCTALTDFTIAETVKEIQTCAFCSCNKLKTLNYEGSLKDWTAIEKQQNWDSLANLTKIQCFDGYLRYDTESGEWEEVKENA